MKTELQLKGATEVTPDRPNLEQLPPLAQAGVSLAKWVLTIICIALVAVFILSICVEFGTSPLADAALQLSKKAATLEPGSPQHQQFVDVLSAIEASRKDTRAHLLAMSQMVLLNLLLPVLTAILG